jgi:hypothetical protein
VKRSGRDEPMWVVIHMCTEATLGIALYSYPYLKLAKMICLSYYVLCFLFKKIKHKRAEQVLPGKEGVEGEWAGGGGAQTMYIHVSKYKNNKVEGKKINHAIWS